LNRLFIFVNLFEYSSCDRCREMVFREPGVTDIALNNINPQRELNCAGLRDRESRRECGVTGLTSNASRLSWELFASALLRPPGRGIPVFSAGKGAGDRLLAVQMGFVQGATPDSSADPVALWRSSISEDRIARAEVVALGVPLDTGAGIRRGAMEGPRGVREALAARPEWAGWLRSGVVLDLGDIFVNPHLLADDMLSDPQLDRCRESMYPDLTVEQRLGFPVSALSQARAVLDRIFDINPSVRVFVLGGDHSVAWPVSQVLSARYPGDLGILQSDAHTDLLPSRLGVRICFGTWSFHANELIGRGGRMVQLGIRQSGRDRAHWESTTEVRQHWADEINGRLSAAGGNPVELLRLTDSFVDELIAHYRKCGVRKIYFSNDIDGTDALWASSTGTPADGGLTPEFLLRVIERLGAEFDWVGSDIMEVAPPIGDSASCARTCELAARYSVASIQVMLGRGTRT
jgi:arginase family enzyme